MPRFEYLVSRFLKAADGAFESAPPRNERGEEALNAMGRDGWELTAFTPDLARPDSYVAIFRRVH